MSVTYEITSLVGDVGTSQVRIENESPTAKTYLVEQSLPANELSRSWVPFGPPGTFTAVPSAGSGAISTLITIQPKSWVEIHEVNTFKPVPVGDERQVTTNLVSVVEKAPVAVPPAVQKPDGRPEIICVKFVQGDPDLMYPDANINAEAIKNLFFCLREDQKACLDWFENDGGGNLCTLIEAVVALQNGTNGVAVAGSVISGTPKAWGTATRSSSQGVATTTPQVIAFGTAVGSGITTAGSGTPFTIITAGPYRINLDVNHDDNGVVTGCLASSSIRVNGTAVGVTPQDDIPTGARRSQSSSTIVNLAVGDVVAALATHSSTNGNTFTASMSINQI